MQVLEDWRRQYSSEAARHKADNTTPDGTPVPRPKALTLGESEELTALGKAGALRMVMEAVELPPPAWVANFQNPG